jgi:cell division control protein 6
MVYVCYVIVFYYLFIFNIEKISFFYGLYIDCPCQVITKGGMDTQQISFSKFHRKITPPLPLYLLLLMRKEKKLYSSFLLKGYGKLFGNFPVEMEPMLANRIKKQIDQMLDNAIILDRRFLNDDHLSREEQEKVLRDIFDENVRQKEIQELTRHFSPVMRQGECLPALGVYGSTGIGKSVTIHYFLQLFSGLCSERNIPFRIVHLDITTPRPCFRALNDMACILGVSKRYERGISLDEFMGKIEDGLKNYNGYLTLFVDEVDNVRRDLDTFLKFLVKRLPKSVPAKVLLILVSNNLNWAEGIDPRIKSVLRMKELIFASYNAKDLMKILSIRIEKALDSSKIEEGVISKIAAVSSRDHGDARKAVELLAIAAEVAEIEGCSINLETVDIAHEKLEREKHVAMIGNCPKQLQAALHSVLQGSANVCNDKTKEKKAQYTGAVYEKYLSLCRRISMRSLTQRAFSDLISELDVYSFIRTRVFSRGRYGRSKEIIIELSDAVIRRLMEVIEANLELR